MKPTNPVSDPHNVYSLRAALSGLNDALQGKNRRKAYDGRPRQAINIAKLGLTARADASINTVIDSGAARMAAEPWRITRAVYPHWPAAWPLANRSVADVLTDCRTGIEYERVRATHWTHDFNRLVALYQAEDALKRLLGI